MLKNAAKILAPSLRILIQFILDTGTWPKLWGESLVVPIPKKETDKSNPLSYRPISLQPMLLKCFEAVYLGRMDLFLKRTGFFASNQHGFSAGASTLTNLLPYWDKVTENIEKKSGMTVICLDIHKGFDRLDIGIALRKIRGAGIRGRAGRFLQNWLLNRSQKVKLGEVVSSKIVPTSGSPQGDCLSPRIFNIYVNDIVKKFKDCSTWYADDCKLYSNCNNLVHSIQLQRRLNMLSKWAERNKVKFSVNKCAVVKIGTEQIDFKYKLNKEIIPVKEEFVDLGVTINSDADFIDHVAGKVEKLSKLVHQFRKNFKIKTEYIMKTYYKSIFSPILCYGANVWFQAKSRIFSLMQKSFENFWSLSSRDIPEDILDPVQSIRYHDLCCVKRIYDGKTCLGFDDYYIKLGGNTRAHEQENLRKQRSENQVRMDSFFVRTVEEWNAVPLGDKKCSTTLFKSFARSHIKHTRRQWRPARDGTIGRVMFVNNAPPRRPIRSGASPDRSV